MQQNWKVKSHSPFNPRTTFNRRVNDALTDPLMLAHHQIRASNPQLGTVALVLGLLHPNMRLTNFNLWLAAACFRWGTWQRCAEWWAWARTRWLPRVECVATAATSRVGSLGAVHLKVGRLQLLQQRKKLRTGKSLIRTTNRKLYN